MKCEITVKVSNGEKAIDIPWEDIKNDYTDFVLAKADPKIQESLTKALKLMESRIRCVFLDRCKKYLIQ